MTTVPSNRATSCSTKVTPELSCRRCFKVSLRVDKRADNNLSVLVISPRYHDIDLFQLRPERRIKDPPTTIKYSESPSYKNVEKVVITCILATAKRVGKR